METIKLIKKLKRWLSVEGNTQIKIAAALGYSTPATVAKWIERGNIPPYQKQPLVEFLNAKQQGE